MSSAPKTKLSRPKRRELERLTKKMEVTKLERLRKTPEYHHAKKAIEAFFEKKKESDAARKH